MPDEWRALAGRGARSRLRSLERAPYLPWRRSGAGGRRAGKGRRIFDLRRPPADLPIASGLAKTVEPLVVLTVGTDCNVGKMTAQLQLTRAAQRRGLRTRFVATGQTGMMIEGWGIAVDAVVADFIAGAAEQLVLEGSRDADIVLVEGQGSINHPGLLRRDAGAAPRLVPRCADSLPPVHAASTSATIARPPGSAFRRSPSTSGWYETIGSAVHPTRVIGMSLNTYDMTDADARRACEAAARETGLPATDPVRFDPAPLVDAVVGAHARHAPRRTA